MPRKFKTIQHYHEPGDVHELTFTCYHRIRLLTNDAWRGYLARSIDEACQAQHYDLVAFVFMPEHVHLLVLPWEKEPELGDFLAAVKRPVSDGVKTDLEKANSPMLARLTIRERPGKHCFRFWQEGPGYDRNMQSTDAVTGAINYLHMNPVRRKLVSRASAWTWSSARFYESDGSKVDARLPRITPLPPEFWME